MNGFRVTRGESAELVHYGDQSNLRVLVGDENQSTPIRVAIQTCKPGYAVPMHCHPYIEYLILLEGSAQFQIETNGTQTVTLYEGDAVELFPGIWHSFTTDPERTTRLMGVHVSSERIVNYKPGVQTDARGFRVESAPAP